MTIINCSVGERLHFGDDICIQLTGRIDDMLYVFIDAKRCHGLDGGDGFHASALCRGGYRVHVLALRDYDEFAIGPVCIKVVRVRVDLPGAQALRDVRLRIDAPMPCVRSTPARARLRQRMDAASCWS
jgi:hypothetical protein